MVDAPRPLAIDPLDRASLAPTPAETRRETFTRPALGIGFALVLIVLNITIWWSRRADWALYTVLGFSPVARITIAIAEWTFACVLPISIGAAWGVLLGMHGDWDRGAAAAGLHVTLALVLTSWLSILWMAWFSWRIAPRRLLAGM
jgi:hypothetical protein